MAKAKIIDTTYEEHSDRVVAYVTLDDGRTGRGIRKGAFFGLASPTEDDKQVALQRAYADATRGDDDDDDDDDDE